jgi:hypothetical protein
VGTIIFDYVTSSINKFQSYLSHKQKNVFSEIKNAYLAALALFEISVLALPVFKNTCARTRAHRRKSCALIWKIAKLLENFQKKRY